MSEGGSRPRTVTSRELLGIRDAQWRQRLSAVSLGAEVLDDIAADDRTQALKCLGRTLGSARSWDHAHLLRQWPAVHVVVTTGVAADHYTSGTFWPYLHDALREYTVTAAHGKQEFQSLWGQAYLRNLDVLGLPTFAESEDTGSKYVGRILMHCGMPNLCLYEYFRLVNERRVKRADLTPEALVSWVADRAARGQMYNMPKPVVRFLQYGDDYAVDVTARVFDLLDAVQAGGDGKDAGLPERFRTVAQELHEHGELRRARQRQTMSGDTGGDERPRILVDPFGRGLVLRLPGVEARHGRMAEWVVDADGHRQRVDTRAWIPGLDDHAPTTDVPLPGPVRAVTAALAGREDLTTTVPVVDGNSPLLAFGEDGELRAPGLPLPGRPVWLLFPGAPDDLQIDGARKVQTESPLPPGWSGWSLLLVDLDDARAVRAGSSSSRPVRRHASARVVSPTPVPGVRTAQGRPVLGALPVVSLPDELKDADWTVAILDVRGDVLARWRRGLDGDDPQAVWNGVPRPLVGSCVVQVRGPWGRGTATSCTIVEGLSTSFSPPWRRFAKDGLQPCTARLGAASGVSLTQTTLTLGAGEREAAVKARALGESLSLVVSPPHMTVTHQSESSISGPSIRPITLFQEDVVADAGRLLLDVGETADPRLHYLVAGNVMQTIDPGVGRNGSYPFDLKRLTDTLDTHPQGRLALDRSGVLTVGEIRPRKLFSDITMVGRAIELTDAADVDGLTAVIYAVHAPWLPPVSVPVIDGRAELPEHLQEAGPLQVTVRIEDPWVPAEIPEWPQPGSSYRVEGAGHVVTDNRDLTRLSAFLAGDQSLSDDVREYKALWTTRGLLWRLGLRLPKPELEAQLDNQLNAHPREALLAVSDSRASIDQIPSMLIRSGLVWADLTDAHDDAPPVWSKRNVLAATLLSAADAEWSADEVDAAVGVCGDALTELLAGKDPSSQIGKIDESVVLFDAHPEMRAPMLKAMSLVPQGLLSADARVLSVVEFVQNRHDSRVTPLTRNARSVLEACDGLLAYLKDPVAHAALGARRPADTTGGWRVIPAISLAWAFAARHAARGRRGAARWLAEHQKSHWAALAEVAPSLVTTDLILAELLVSSARPTTDGNAQ